MTATSAARGWRRFRVAVGAFVGATLGLASGLISGKPSDALAQSLCGPQPPPPPAGSCQRGWVCTGGGWTETWYAIGTACDDANSCTTNDVCDSTHNCNGTPLADGTGCNDGNSCTTSDHCSAGRCVGTAVSCTAQDQCHVAGTCDPATGACSNPVKANGTPCNDGSACTSGETCQNGACGSPTSTVTCTALDACHVLGVCNPSTGTCSNPPGNEGASCNDGNACTFNDKCVQGGCVGTAITCTSTTCQALACQGTSTCLVVSNAASSVQCNDGNACTSGDHCDGNGTCTGTPIIGCTATPDHGCANPNKALGTACDDLNACTYSDHCDGMGNCVGTAITCSPSGPCETAACNGTSSCTYTLLPADTACPGVDDPCRACTGTSNMCQ